jgi:hypothetical protein
MISVDDLRWGALDERAFLNRLAARSSKIRPDRAAASIEAYRSRMRELMDDEPAFDASEPGNEPTGSQSGTHRRLDPHAARVHPREGEMS